MVKNEANFDDFVCRTNYKNTWDKYVEKHNELVNLLEENQIDPILLRDIIDLRLEIEKINSHIG